MSEALVTPAGLGFTQGIGAGRLGFLMASSGMAWNLEWRLKLLGFRGCSVGRSVARPIGLQVLKPNQENRAFEVLKQKFYCDGGRGNVGEDYEGRGFKIYPAPESEKPR